MLIKSISFAAAALLLFLAGCPNTDAVNGLLVTSSANVNGQSPDQRPGVDGLDADGSANINGQAPDETPDDGSGLEPDGSANVNENAGEDVPGGNSNSPPEPETPHTGTQALIFLRGRPIDGFSAINVSVTEVELLGDTTIAFPLAAAARVNLLTEGTSAFLVCLDDAPFGEFSKLRLTIASPEFVRTDGSVVPASQTRILANGKLDLNGRGDPIDIRESQVNIVELTLADGDNSLRVNQTGNGMHSLRSEIFVTPRNALSAPLDIATAIVLSTDAGDGPGDADENLIEIFDGQCGKRVALRPATAVDGPRGPRSVVDIVDDLGIRIIGRYDADRGIVVAERIQILR